VLDDMLKAKSVWSKKRASGFLHAELVKCPAATACGKFVRYKHRESPYLYFRTYEIDMSYISLVCMIHIFRSYVTIHNAWTKNDSSEIGISPTSKFIVTARRK